MNEKCSEILWVRLQTEILEVSSADAFLRDPAAGGVNLFVGTTRQWTGDRETVELEYECYASMALREMERLAEAALEQRPVTRVCILHRLGIVPVAEASVVIGVASPHRAGAFDACRWLIDTLKRQVPIWKREVYSDGETEWVQGPVPPEVV